MTSSPGTEAPQGGFVEWAFRLSLLGKAALGLFQIMAGIALWIAPAGSVPQAAAWLVRNEIVEDPSDPIVGAVMAWAGTFNAAAEQFYVLYFLGHGLLHFCVVVALLLKWRVAYPISLGTLCVFVAYQVVRYLTAPDPALLVLTAIDVFVIVIVILEHRQTRARRQR